MKDRLLNLHNEAYKEWQNLDRGEPGACIPSFAEYCTDHLIESGVLIPPVKVGQTVYVIDQNPFVCRDLAGNMTELNWISEVTEKIVEAIIYDGNGFVIRSNDCYHYSAEELFIIKEDAEKALKEKANR